MTLHPLARRIAALEQAAEPPDTGMPWVIAPEDMDPAARAAWQAAQHAGHPVPRVVVWSIVDPPARHSAALATPLMEITT